MPPEVLVCSFAAAAVEDCTDSTGLCSTAVHGVGHMCRGSRSGPFGSNPAAVATRLPLDEPSSDSHMVLLIETKPLMSKLKTSFAEMILLT